MTLQNEQDAIKQAVEAGWKPFDWGTKWKCVGVSVQEGKFEAAGRPYISKSLARIFQDPAFWIALGEARGWGYQEATKTITDFVCQDCGTSVGGTGEHNCDYSELKPFWLYYALRYFETKLSGGDTQAFWQNLP